jgi:hypothetical protein
MLRFIFRLLILIILALIGYSTFAYIQYQKGAYRDLGVKYQMADYESAIKKLKINIADPTRLYYGVFIKGRGENKVDDTFSEKEVTAFLDIANREHGPFRNVQVKLLSANRFEASFHYTGGKYNLPGPIFFSGDLELTGNDGIVFKFDEIFAGDFKLPKFARERMSGSFNRYIHDVIGNMDVFNVEKLSLGDGKADFKGLIPSNIESY